MKVIFAFLITVVLTAGFFGLTPAGHHILATLGFATADGGQDGGG